MTISEIAYNNMKFLCKKKGVPLASIEQACCRSVGWFSRAQKRNAICLSDIEIASKMLDCTLTQLISGDLKKQERIAAIRELIWKAEKELEELTNA